MIEIKPSSFLVSMVIGLKPKTVIMNFDDQCIHEVAESAIELLRQHNRNRLADIIEEIIDLADKTIDNPSIAKWFSEDADNVTFYTENGMETGWRLKKGMDRELEKALMDDKIIKFVVRNPKNSPSTVTIEFQQYTLDFQSISSAVEEIIFFNSHVAEFIRAIGEWMNRKRNLFIAECDTFKWDSRDPDTICAFLSEYPETKDEYTFEYIKGKLEEDTNLPFTVTKKG